MSASRSARWISWAARRAEAIDVRARNARPSPPDRRRGRLCGAGTCGLCDHTARPLGLRARARADPCEPQPPVRHHGLPAPVPRGGSAPRHRTGRRQAGRPQLRPWRQRLVALLGLGACRSRQGDAAEPERDCRDRLRRARTHHRHRRAAGRRACNDLCARPPSRHPLGARDGKLDAGLAHRAHRQSGAGIPRIVGTDGADLVPHLPALSGPARQSGGMDRPLLSERRRSCRASSAFAAGLCELFRPHPGHHAKDRRIAARCDSPSPRRPPCAAHRSCSSTSPITATHL